MAQKRKQIRSTSRLLALEPRLLFDGAAMVAAQDAIQPNDAAKEVQDSNHASDAPDDAFKAQAQLDFDGSNQDVTAKDVVLIDIRVNGYQDLATQAQANGAQVHIVDAATSGLAAIGDALAQAQNVSHLQIIAFNGESGSQLGSDTINSQQLNEQWTLNPHCVDFHPEVTH